MSLFTGFDPDWMSQNEGRIYLYRNKEECCQVCECTQHTIVFLFKNPLAHLLPFYRVESLLVANDAVHGERTIQVLPQWRDV